MHSSSSTIRTTSLREDPSQYRERVHSLHLSRKQCYGQKLLPDSSSRHETGTRIIRFTLLQGDGGPFTVSQGQSEPSISMGSIRTVSIKKSSKDIRIVMMGTQDSKGRLSSCEREKPDSRYCLLLTRFSRFFVRQKSIP